MIRKVPTRKKRNTISHYTEALRSTSASLAALVFVTASMSSGVLAKSDGIESLGNCALTSLRNAQSGIKTGKYSEARAELEDSLESCEGGALNDNELANIYNLLAVIEYKSGDNESAIRYYQKALTHKNIPSMMLQSVRYTSAQLMFAEKRWGEGLKLLESYEIDAQRKPAALYALMGKAYSMNGDLDKAIHSMEKALSMGASTTQQQRSNWAKQLASMHTQRGDKQRSLQILAEYDIDSTLSHVPQSFKTKKSPPRPVQIIAPYYPPSAKDRGITGYCVVKFTVDERGNVASERIEQCEPTGVFEKASLSAIREFRYDPAVINGVPVEQENVTRRFVFD